MKMLHKMNILEIMKLLKITNNIISNDDSVEMGNINSDDDFTIMGMK